MAKTEVPDGAVPPVRPPAVRFWPTYNEKNRAGDHRAWSLLLSADYLLCHIGYFSVLPILAAVISHQLPGNSGFSVGAALFAYTSAVGISCLLVTRWISRFSYATAMAGGLLLSAAGMAGIPYVHSIGALVLLLLVAGGGLSVHGLLGRSLIAEITSGDIERNKMFSALNIAVNVAAAAGPFIATALYAVGAGKPLFLLVAGCYATAATLVLWAVPRDLRPRPKSGIWPVSRATLAVVLRDRDALRTALMAAAGSFLYAQFFSAFAILVAKGIENAPLRAGLFTANALAVVVLQVPVSALVGRLMKRGVKPLAILGSGTALFALAMLLLSGQWPLLLSAYLSVLVFSAAETLFAPMVNTAFSGLPIDSPLEAFNLRQIFCTFGESTGAFCGGGLFLILYSAGHGDLYWLSLSAGALIVTGILMVPSRNRLKG
ncbi:MFS transporter [Streptomyces sp. TBY4]|uniref:MFS transporter n=1 Tax=Streptomyces sp. TBY4 TaxID=2962030 RepID=UPI0020B76251|nr:MFS transporter [Streptomyces sp. TBY4]MCP3755584.1 MFS transporter [Streptomyces sp. TBY4]